MERLREAFDRAVESELERVARVKQFYKYKLKYKTCFRQFQAPNFAAYYQFLGKSAVSRACEGPALRTQSEREKQ